MLRTIRITIAPEVPSELVGSLREPTGGACLRPDPTWPRGRYFSRGVVTAPFEESIDDDRARELSEPAKPSHAQLRRDRQR